jgi:hypothetical protein
LVTGGKSAHNDVGHNFFIIKILHNNFKNTFN